MKIGFLFAGQGSEYVSMGKELYDEYKEARNVFDNINLDFDVKNLCFNGPYEILHDTKYAQSCILATSLAIAEVVKSYGIVPSYVAGLSLGEYSALCYAGAFDICTALEITKERGRIMADALKEGTTSMAAVIGLDEEIIKKICNEVSENYGVCEIANYNAPGQIVITGENNAIKIAEEKLLEKGAKRVIKTNDRAFHSSLLEDASKELKKVLQSKTIKKPNIKVVYNISGKEEHKNLVDVLTNQIKSSVYFKNQVEYMINKGVNTFIEIGPGSVLKGLVKRINSDVKVYSVDSVKSINEMLSEVKENE
ncbi:MAG: ACP S-malonyltransferase [Tenericutes bacterium]|nr:ACP S-malonyltransferase [Mycoplasmatota bacterium]